MLINTRVVWVCNPNTGIDGWRIKRVPSFDPVASAAGLTHDILEHSRNDKGTWAEEVQAYGAMIAWRMDASDNLFAHAKEIHKPELLGNDLGYFLNNWMQSNSPSLFEMQVKEFKAIPDVIKQVADSAYGCLYRLQDNYFTATTVEEAKLEILNKLHSWLMIGYKRAVKVIEESGYHPGDLWSTVHDQINMYMFKQDYVEGTEVSIQIDTDRCWCRVLPIQGYQF
jgi:hypothetical protein